MAQQKSMAEKTFEHGRNRNRRELTNRYHGTYSSTVPRQYSRAFKRYGNVLYGIFAPSDDATSTLEAITAFLDLMFEERGGSPLSGCSQDSNRIRQQWMECLMPDVSEKDVVDLLEQRRVRDFGRTAGNGEDSNGARLDR